MKNKMQSFIFLLLFSILLTSCHLLPEEDGQETSDPGGPQPSVGVEPDEMPDSELSISTLLGHETGNFELSITMELEEKQECKATYPFSIRTEGDRILLTGDSEVVLDCHFTEVSCIDACVTMNVIFDFNTRFDGEILVDTSDPTNQTVELYYFYDGLLIEYYTEYPEDTPMPYTEDTPLELVFGDLKPAAIQFEEDAVIILMGDEGELIPDDLPLQLEHAVWTLTLHLQ